MKTGHWLPLLVVFPLASLACAGNEPAPDSPATAAAPAAAPPPAPPPAEKAVASAPATPPPSEPPAAPPPPSHTPSTLDGSIVGQPFHGVAACIVGRGKDPGTAYIEVYSVKDFDTSKSCGRLPSDKDARKLGMLIPWSDGAQTDAAKMAGGKEPALFVMQGTGNPRKFDRKDTGKDFKPKGTISVVRFGAKKGDVARIKVDLTMGKDKLQGEVDVDVMMDLSS